MAGLSRRYLIGGLLAGLAGEALADAPRVSLRPLVRPGGSVAPSGAPVKPEVTAAAELISRANLGGKVSFAVADMKTGEMLEAEQGDVPMPPASTAKIITTLYALSCLGPGYRFATRLIGTGPIVAGNLTGDLVLAGGGDPLLSTDGLGDMASDLARTGLRRVKGGFRVWGGALPYLSAIDASQPDYLGFNPAVSGLNLNFNRVNFVWKRAGGDYELSMDARAERFAPQVYSSRIRVVDRDLPVYTYARDARHEDWTVARRALGKGGSRWLPVRRPQLYAGDVFQTLARAAGVPLPAPEVAAALPEGTALVEQRSADLRAILKDMLKYSTNLTAEAVGMAASVRRGISSHVASGREMSRWANERAGVTSIRLVDHSGLGGASRISTADMVRVLVRLGPDAGMRGLLKGYAFHDDSGRKLKGQDVRVSAKTGTLNFVSALAGYITTADGRELAFATLTGDVARRDAIPESQRERPEGSRAWVVRSRRLQQALIERWAAIYGA
ncbi:MAG: D-alanyl-D-alanine carboxypeptidase/D-alanyl-D-alanine-endopeptidase [Rhodobacteraceae bacterium]|nr:D-alanyl-D-alanine carboxypeptidase/D-alanyl-D-alanine-endopeptidase [Paracoccaceae bacterium]MCP5342171.1 D-alanyl-D-alanine carboxypeptidase/D-alanyl-D-alanine-endopeptidase [Paracoccaceae bacterium]